MRNAVKVIGVLTCLVSVPAAVHAFNIDWPAAGRYVSATRAAVCGPSKNNVLLKAGGIHGFNVKKASFIPSVDQSSMAVTGQLSHRLSFRPDDQIYYTLTYANAGNGVWKLTEIKNKINRGGWGAFLGPVWLAAQAIGVANGSPIPIKPDDVAKNTVDTAALIGGNWEGATAILISNIAIASSNPNYCST